jgi:hypothetical protein
MSWLKRGVEMIRVATKTLRVETETPAMMTPPIAGGERTNGIKDDTTDASKQTDGGSASAAKKKKAIRKDRDPPTLGTKHEDFTKVSRSGAPEEPKALAVGYRMQIGCIIRETMTINTRNL